MDSITHALYRTIVAEDERQRKLSPEALGTNTNRGLQPLSLRPTTWEGYAGAKGTDLHIYLERSPELLALQLEFLAAGYSPPGGMAQCGGEVIIGKGRIDLYVPTDSSSGTWVASLGARAHRHDSSRRAAWQEEVL